MKTSAVIISVFLSVISLTSGFLVEGWVEEWEYENGTDFAPESRPGFRIRVTQKGFETAAKLGLDAIMAHIDTLVIPDVTQTIANAEVTVSNVRINRLARPKAEIKTVPGQGLFARIYKVQPKVTADYKAVASWGFFGSTEAAGEVIIRGKNLRFSIELIVGRNEQEEFPQHQIDTKCLFEGELNVLFAGDLEDILNVGSAVFGSNIMSLIASSICGEVKKQIDNNMATNLSSLPVNDTADLEFDFNFGMVRFPQFNEDFMELYHRGTVYYLENKVEPPFQPDPIPPCLNHTDKMIYIYVSDYVMNSALYAGYLSGYLAYNVTPTILPPVVQKALRTVCEEPDVCLGSVFPRLGILYPGSIAGVYIFATSYPQMHTFNGTTANIYAQGNAIFFVDDDMQERNFLFKIQFNISGGATVRVNGSTVKFGISFIRPVMAISESYIGDIGTGGAAFQRVMAVAAEKFVIPKLTEIGETGIELPKTEEFEFVDPEVISLDADGSFVVATDFDISLPPELLDEGVQTFRRKKGCKRDCTTTAPPSLYNNNNSSEQPLIESDSGNNDEVYTDTTTPRMPKKRNRPARTRANEQNRN